MGGQACILYGAAEFSRDIDFAALSSADNLERLRKALDELGAEVIAVPPFERRHLERGHAVHFRAHHADAEGLLIDVTSRLRGVDPFPRLWERRATFELVGAGEVDALSLPDLVAATTLPPAFAPAARSPSRGVPGARPASPRSGPP